MLDRLGFCLLTHVFCSRLSSFASLVQFGFILSEAFSFFFHFQIPLTTLTASTVLSYFLITRDFRELVNILRVMSNNKMLVLKEAVITKYRNSFLTIVRPQDAQVQGHSKRTGEGSGVAGICFYFLAPNQNCASVF